MITLLLDVFSTYFRITLIFRYLSNDLEKFWTIFSKVKRTAQSA